jgi:hypothetical protein
MILISQPTPLAHAISAPVVSPGRFLTWRLAATSPFDLEGNVQLIQSRNALKQCLMWKRHLAFSAQCFASVFEIPGKVPKPILHRME